MVAKTFHSLIMLLVFVLSDICNNRFKASRYKRTKTATGEIGTPLSFAEIDTLFNEEQLVQLFDLYKASTGIPDLNESKDDSPIKN